jgi:hypothetical protein
MPHGIYCYKVMTFGLKRWSNISEGNSEVPEVADREER